MLKKGETTGPSQPWQEQSQSQQKKKAFPHHVHRPSLLASVLGALGHGLTLSPPFSGVNTLFPEKNSEKAQVIS
jgi:hypothetical protein